MIVAIDIGNTNTTLGIFKNGKISSFLKFQTHLIKDNPSNLKQFNNFFKNKTIKGIVISSVVPNVCKTITKYFLKHLKIKPLIISNKLNLGVNILYEKPNKLGADRICNIVAAYYKYGYPTIIIDFGTAITYDIISKEGNFIGGIIAPGIEISSSCLKHRTAQLPSVDFRFPKNIIGKNTTTALQSGIMFGTLYATECFIKEIKKQLGKKTKVIGTGGYVDLFANKSKMINYVEKHLVLKGAYLIYNKVINNI